MTRHHSAQKGFTLIETVVAIFILSLTIGALLTLAAGSIFSVRYARNQIVADNLMQQTIEYLHNSRDSIAAAGSTWNDFLKTLNVDTTGQQFDISGTQRGCFGLTGCVIDPFTTSTTKLVRECPVDGGCSPISYYPDYGFYGYDIRYPFGDTSNKVTTSYVETVTARFATDPNQIIVTVTMTWKNGLNPKTISHTTILTNWHI